MLTKIFKAAAAAFVALGVSGIAASSVSPAEPDRVAKCLARYGGGSDGGRNTTTTTTTTTTYRTDFPGLTWDDDAWLLSTTTLDQGRFQSRGAVANGYFGINVASVGPFFEVDNKTRSTDVIDGWPLYSRRQSFATVAGFWNAQPRTNGTNFAWLLQYGYESVVSGLPHWAGLILDLGDGRYLDANVDNATVRDFRTTYDFAAGVLTWSYRWTPSSSGSSYDIRYLLFANKLHVNEAVVDLQIVPSADGDANVVNILDGSSAVRTDFVSSGDDAGALYSAVRPSGITNITAFVYTNVTGSEGVDVPGRKLVKDKPYIDRNASTVAQSVPVRFRAGKPVRITKYVGIASGDAFADPQDTARKAVASAQKRGFEKSLKEHVEEWAAVLPAHSVDSFADPKTKKLPDDIYVIDSAISAVTNAYYLLQNTVGPNAQRLLQNAPVNVDSIAVGGLTSDSYAGLIFWDADLFMQPGLVVSHPQSAERITNYRVKHYAQAKANAQTSFTSSKNRTTFSSDAAIYPWTSGRFGNCTATGPCWDYEYHLSGDVGLSFLNHWVTTGDTRTFKDTMFPIYDAVATTYSQVLQPNGTRWTLTNMTDPDEYANHVDAGGFTMPLIAETLRTANSLRSQFGKQENSTWDSMADNVLVLRENGITLEFTTMNGTATVKQADVILNTFPLSYTTNYTAQDSLNDLNYYANKQSPDGPAMTWAFFSIVANDISPSGCAAYTYAQYSYKPYLRAPFYQLSEQLSDNTTINGGTHPAFPFLTGHGGANQVTIFGYLGLRLLPDDVLHINPNLPPQLSHLRYRTFYWRGWPLSAWSNATHTTIERAAHVRPLATADQRFANQSIMVDLGIANTTTPYKLPVNGTVTVPNRDAGRINTVPGDLIQCRPAQSSEGYRPGQFPIAANDGATSTKWQPEFADTRSAVTVAFADEDVGGAMVAGFRFNWAQEPPVNATVVFHNTSLANASLPFAQQQRFSSQYTVISHLTNINISDPYVPGETDLDAIVTPVGNTTNVTLDKPVAASRFATLIISGNQALSKREVEGRNGTGATVAAWAIISDQRRQRDEKTPKARLRRSLAWREKKALLPIRR